ncbi:MAG: CBS domain-containing protein [Rhodoplanes sp.]|uniref:CBS domain-containing protein n=1 Tax=Rhodoplanes sp. TaxID=1968906 RepID=UPI0018027FF4|nr:CBS domain-containing protein [Rhodoplanes sp.]NVO13557.1 CBS domain-containing protein [Rhodoplanes sp.]
MKAADIMTRTVITVEPDAPARVIAKLLHQNGISAVPVVDEAGLLLGMVSEGDLIPRDEHDRDARRDWWLRMLSEGEELNAEFVAHLEKDKRVARDIMTSPVITVPEDADIIEVAGVLAGKRIKRAPVLSNGRMLGIVSRADLVRAIAGNGSTAAPPPSERTPDSLQAAEEHLTALQARMKQKIAGDAASAAKAAPPPATGPGLSASSFRGLVERHEKDESTLRSDTHRQAQEKRQHEASEMLAAELTDAAWSRMIHEAQVAAEKGETEHMLLRFPCELCTDHGRAINVPDPEWPATLRGLAARVFLRWQEELRSKGFGLTARIVDFPDGVPGDVGLFLSWGK